MKKVFTIIDTLKHYYYLTKPGIVRGNAITATAGFLLASKRQIDWGLFIEMLIGLSLVIASACIFNNVIDRDIDEKMARTKQRAIVQGTIGPRAALIYGSLLGLTGFGILRIWVNWLTALIALLGWLAYVVIYTKAKRHTKYGTLIGSLSGATPPVVGYCAVTGQFDLAAMWLFVILACWQMPHFYAIAIFRAKEYKAADIPVWSLTNGIQATKNQILMFVAAFTASLMGLWLGGYTGRTYMVIALVLGLYWLWNGFKGLKTRDNDRWAKQMFGISLLVLLVFSVLISIDVYLP
jgi:protoheme IX farnesyltransferase